MLANGVKAPAPALENVTRDRLPPCRLMRESGHTSLSGSRLSS
jgi:hypothetical protein